MSASELENTATRIPSDFTPDHADLIEKQRKKQKRRERRIKRAIVSAIGWSVIAGMIYLIIVTARTVPKIWDPYEVLGVSRVGAPVHYLAFETLSDYETVGQRVTD